MWIIIERNGIGDWTKIDAAALAIAATLPSEVVVECLHFNGDGAAYTGTGPGVDAEVWLQRIAK